MTRQTTTATDQLLVYATALPLQWVPEVSSDPAYLIHLQYRNERLLRQLAILEQQGPEVIEEHGAGQELQRIEAKINLLLDLAGDLLARQSGLRPAVAVRISARSVQWPVAGAAPAPTMPIPAAGMHEAATPTAEAPTTGALATGALATGALATGALGEVHLWLRPDLPRPLCLPARIVAVGDWIEAEYCGLGESLLDSLEKTIFRYHRRQVAMTRAARPQD
ncbi:MAG TPA: hypothetical protein VFV18_00740 [Porticoccaceae bacterium]|nr:hypothetical protein [Porticoccaceae bacterium]